MPKNKQLEIDDAVFRKRVKALSDKLGRDEKDFIREQTGLLAKEVSRMTAPYASYPKLSNAKSVGTSKDIAAGKGAVVKDMLKIVTTRKTPTIKWAKKTFGTGPVIFEKRIAAGVITSVSELAQWHEQNANNKGRVNWLSPHERKWVAPVVLNKYLRILKARVGRAKATFYKVALLLGAKVSAPANVKKNTGSVSSSGSVAKRFGKTVGMIKGREGGLAYTIKHLPKLRNNRLIKALKRGEYLMKQSAKKAGFKTK